MKVINAVFSKQNGGLEQASLDYAHALKRPGHEVILLLGASPPFLKQAQVVGCAIHRQKNRLGYLDPIAALELRSWLKKQKPDAIFAHGNRAISLLRKAARNIAPVVAVNHTTSVKRSKNADAVITVNEALKKDLLALGHASASSVYVVPNMVAISDAQRQAAVPAKPSSPPVLGALARFTPEKGLDVFVDALAELKRRNVAFRARIGGSGTLKDELEAQVRAQDLQTEVEFCGWVEDQGAFYNSLDIFCLPSRAETFGIVMLEAMLHKRPVIATQAHGPKELASGREVALFVPVEDSHALADAAEKLLADWPQAQRLAQAGFDLVAEKYDIQTVSGQLERVLQEVTIRWKERRAA